MDKGKMLMKTSWNFLIRIIATCVLLATATVFAQGGSYPTKPIKIIAPFPPGGNADILARLVAQKLSEAWNQPVIVENRPGGNAMIGAELVAKSAADGYTYLLAGTAHTANVSLYPKAANLLQKELTTVAMVGLSSSVVVVRADSQILTLQEVVTAAKTKNLSAGSSGNGAPSHLGLELFKGVTGANILHVPYKGGASALIDLLGGQIDLYFALMAEGAPYVKAAKLRALAVTSASRNPLLPDVPTTAEAGVPGLGFTTWNGLMIPSGTPNNIVEVINAEVNRITATTEMKLRLIELGFKPVVMNVSETESFVRADVARWSKVIREANIKAD